jgi:hypothetical protein
VIRFQAGLLLARRMRDHNAHRLELLDAARIAYVQLSRTAYRPRRALLDRLQHFSLHENAQR